MEKVKFEGICDWIQKCLNVRFSSRKGHGKRADGGGGGQLNKVILSGGICPKFQTLSLYKPFLTKKAPLSYLTLHLKTVPSSVTCLRTVHLLFKPRELGS